MESLLPSLIVLGVAAVAAGLFVTYRPPAVERLSARNGAARALALATAIQGIHFLEEAATGFPDRLGALFGLPGMPPGFFLGFNLAWLGVWVVSVPGLRSGRAWAYFAAWFLAIAGMFNGVLHPLLWLVSGAYFPGAVSSPFIGAAGVWLFVRLLAATDPGDRPDPAVG